MNRVRKALLILLLEYTLFGPIFIGQFDVAKSPRTLDEYWAEAGLSKNELLPLLSDANCYFNQKNFLSCVSSIVNIAERYNFIFTPDGILRKLNEGDVSQRLTEKKELSLWRDSQKKIKQHQISFLKIWTEIEKNLIKPGEESSAIAAGINGYLSVNRDPHTYILPIKMYDEVIAAKESRQISLGFLVKRELKYLLVRKVFEGSPAYLAGVRRGDRITRLNDDPVQTLLPSRVSDILKLRNTNRLGLEVERGNKRVYLELIKTETLYPSVVAKISNNNSQVGLLTIHKFSRETCSVSRGHIQSFIEQGIRGIVLDLRDNPGGQVNEATCIINLFVDRGTKLFETRYLNSNRQPDIYEAQIEPIYKGSLVVLVNSGSASAAEIVAGSLKDLGRATLIGEKTFGKGSFQDGKYWAPNSKIAFFETEGFYYFPSGWTSQLTGIEPDINVAFNNVDRQRESDLFIHPLNPKNKIAHSPVKMMTQMNLAFGNICDLEKTEAELAIQTDIDDPQFLKAQAVLKCGARYGNNGSF